MKEKEWIEGSHGELETTEHCYSPTYTQHTITTWRTDGFMYSPDMERADITYHFTVAREGKQVYSGTHTFSIKGSEGRHAMRLLHMFFAGSDFPDHALSREQMRLYTQLADEALNHNRTQFNPVYPDKEGM